MAEQRLTGGEAIARALVAHGIGTVYGIPGVQVYGLFDALARAGIRVVTPRHEQTCGYMAYGQARATGGPAAYAVVPGPGVLNTTAALLTAAGGNEQVLCLTGQVPTPFLGLGRGHLHEMRDQQATLATIAKWVGHAATPAAAPGLLAEAFRQMASGRPGPAAIEMPWEQVTAEAVCPDVAPLPPLPDPEPGAAIGRAAAAIARAEAPMIFVGSGAFGAEAAVLELAERIGAPVVAFRSGRGVVSNAHPLGLTLAEARHLWRDCDCVIGIGTRLEVPSWRWPARPELPVLRFEIDPAELARTPEAIGVLGRAGPSLAALLAEPALQMPAKPAWAERIRAARARTGAEVARLTPYQPFVAALRAAIPEDGILTDEMCQAGYVAWLTYPVWRPRSFISSGYQGTLGSGLPTALGVKLARPEAPVVAITGDGGLMFGVQELGTAAQYGLDVVTVVFANGAFGNVRRDQMAQFDGRLVGSEFRNPDFARLAGAFDVAHARAETPEALGAAVRRGLEAGGPWLIEVPVTEPEVSPWPMMNAAI